MMHKLPVQLLARILLHLDTHSLLGACALVSSTWRTAATLAVRHISVRTNCTQPRATALSAWLAAHGQQVTSMEAGCLSEPPPPATNRPELVLPVKQLPKLRQLKLQHLDVSTVDNAGAAAPLFGGSQGLTSSLTHLELLECTASLQDLRSCTALQHLSISAPDPGSVITLLEADLPQLQALTSLHLHAAAAHDRVLVAAGPCLMRLQELSLQSVDTALWTAGSFNHLPSSLSRLGVSCEWDNAEGGVTPNAYLFSPSSAHGLVGLTALKDLTLAGAAIDVAMLAMLTQLSSLQLQAVVLRTPEGGPTLRVLTALTRLCHLALPPCDVDPDCVPVAPSAEDIAAITASQLTFLNLPHIADELEPALFPAGVELPHLAGLVMHLHQLPSTASRMVAACPRLQQLSLVTFYKETIYNETIYKELLGEPNLIPGVVGLTRLTALTTLSLQADVLDLGAEEWQALGRLTGLQVLDMECIAQPCIAGFGQLTGLQQLNQLRLVWTPVEWFQGGSWDDQYFELVNTAPEGSPSNIWSQLPVRGMQMLDLCVSALRKEGGAEGQSFLGNEIIMRQEACNRVLQSFWKAFDSTVLQPPSESAELAALRARVSSLEQQLQLELAAAARPS